MAIFNLTLDQEYVYPIALALTTVLLLKFLFEYCRKYNFITANRNKAILIT